MLSILSVPLVHADNIRKLRRRIIVNYSAQLLATLSLAVPLHSGGSARRYLDQQLQSQCMKTVERLQPGPDEALS